MLKTCSLSLSIYILIIVSKKLLCYCVSYHAMAILVFIYVHASYIFLGFWCSFKCMLVNTKHFRMSTHKITLNCLKIYVTILKIVKKIMRKSVEFMPARFYPILILLYVTTVTVSHSYIIGGPYLFPKFLYRSSHFC